MLTNVKHASYCMLMQTHTNAYCSYVVLTHFDYYTNANCIAPKHTDVISLCAALKKKVWHAASLVHYSPLKMHGLLNAITHIQCNATHWCGLVPRVVCNIRTAIKGSNIVKRPSWG